MYPPPQSHPRYYVVLLTPLRVRSPPQSGTYHTVAACLPPCVKCRAFAVYRAQWLGRNVSVFNSGRVAVFFRQRESRRLRPKVCFYVCCLRVFFLNSSARTRGRQTAKPGSALHVCMYGMYADESLRTTYVCQEQKSAFVGVGVLQTRSGGGSSDPARFSRSILSLHIMPGRW